jgi:hypothetical protein
MKRITNRDQLVFDEPELNLHPVRLKIGPILPFRGVGH